eukprot:maker-scaffold_30-snap-gene-3.24-mRNA-1 protein AED:0.11 eAED:0.93 QI:0/0/0/0.75/1/1/4/0/360
MCLTVFGETSPTEELCGKHGHCVENICVCDSGWSRSIDLFPKVYAGNGAEQIFNSLEQNRSIVTLNVFVEELSLSAPCTENLFFWNLIHILASVCGLVVLFVITKVQKNKQKTNGFETLKKLSVFYIAVVHFVKLLERDPQFPFTLHTSILLGAVAFLSQAVIYLFFIKHTKYHLKKAKALYTLRPMLWGVNLEHFFFFQINFSFVLNVIAFGGSWIISPLVVQGFDQKQAIDSSIILFLRIFPIMQNVVGALTFLFLLILSKVLTTILLGDLHTLLQFYPSTQSTTTFNQIADEENARKKKTISITKLISQIKHTDFIMTFWCGNAEVILQNIFPIAMYCIVLNCIYREYSNLLVKYNS